MEHDDGLGSRFDSMVGACALALAIGNTLGGSLFTICRLQRLNMDLKISYRCFTDRIL
jgi:hypothetical protein